MRSIIGASLIGLILVLALLAPWLSPQSPMQTDLVERYRGPSWSHPFGQDENGADVLAQVLYGARVSVKVALLVVLISAVTGLIAGSFAAIKGGHWDNALMRGIDMIYAFPGFLLALALISVLGPSVNNLILALCLTTWTGFARLVRGELLHLKEKEYVQAAIAQGAGVPRLLLRHLWPNCLGLIFVQATFTASATVVAESGLSFLGLGAPITTPTWGALLNSGRKFLFEAPHIALFPGLAIVVMILAFNLLGDGLRQRFNPRAE